MQGIPCAGGDEAICDWLGPVERETSHDHVMVGGESVVNEVAFSYDGFNQMTTDVQSHSGGMAYDGAGNMTSLRPGGADGDDWDENRTLTWDAWNRLEPPGGGGGRGGDGRGHLRLRRPDPAHRVQEHV